MYVFSYVVFPREQACLLLATWAGSQCAGPMVRACGRVKPCTNMSALFATKVGTITVVREPSKQTLERHLAVRTSNSQEPTVVQIYAAHRSYCNMFATKNIADMIIRKLIKLRWFSRSQTWSRLAVISHDVIAQCGLPYRVEPGSMNTASHPTTA